MHRFWCLAALLALATTSCADSGIIEPAPDDSSVVTAAVAAYAGARPVCHGMPATIWDTMDETLLPEGATIRAVPAGDHVLHIIHGTDGPDVIVAGGGPDIVYGDNGDDVICTGGGADQVYGNNGDDRIFAGGGPDRVQGGPGNDVIEGGPARDLLFGGANDDVIYAGAGPDLVFGEAGDDHLIGGLEPLDAMYGGAGNNLLEWTGEQDIEHDGGCSGGGHDGGDEHDHADDSIRPPQSAHGRGQSSGCDGAGHDS